MLNGANLISTHLASVFTEHGYALSVLDLDLNAFQHSNDVFTSGSVSSLTITSSTVEDDVDVRSSSLSAKRKASEITAIDIDAEHLGNDFDDGFDAHSRTICDDNGLWNDKRQEYVGIDLKLDKYSKDTQPIVS